MKGDGTTLASIFHGLPYWGGVVLVGVIITLNVALGGMKGITLLQAFQWWTKMFATSVSIFVLMAVYGTYGAHLEKNRSPGEAVPSALVAETTYERQELPAKAPVYEAWISPFGPHAAKAADKAGLSVEEPRPYSL